MSLAYIHGGDYQLPVYQKFQVWLNSISSFFREEVEEDFLDLQWEDLSLVSQL